MIAYALLKKVGLNSRYTEEGFVSLRNALVAVNPNAMKFKRSSDAEILSVPGADQVRAL